MNKTRLKCICIIFWQIINALTYDLKFAVIYIFSFSQKLYHKFIFTLDQTKKKVGKGNGVTSQYKLHCITNIKHIDTQNRKEFSKHKYREHT